MAGSPSLTSLLSSMCCWWFLLLTLLPCELCLARVKKAPHIVFIVADDLGWNDVGWHNPAILTPNMNWLARNGVILDSAYVQPACTPSRNSFMTGMYPSSTELQEVIHPSQPLYLPLKYKTIAEELKTRGYSTHAVGKWHLGHCNEKYTPLGRGFDSFMGTFLGSGCHYYHRKPETILKHTSSKVTFSSMNTLLMNSMMNFRTVADVSGTDYWFNNTAWTSNLGQYSTHTIGNRATEIIRRHDPDKPLFLYLPFQAVHSPITVPREYEMLYGHIHSSTRRIFAGMVSAMDEAIGNVTSALFERGFMDNLLMVFISDNGGQPYLGGNNLPLRGGKNSLWEGGTRVPSFAYSHTLFKKRGYVNNGLLHASDFFPTFQHLAGGYPDPGLDGVNQWDMISRGRRSSRYEMLYNVKSNGGGALRIGDYKLIVGKAGLHNDWYPEAGIDKISRSRFKGGRFDNVVLSHQRHHLYNIKDDPEERYDIASKKPDILDAMLLRYQQFNATKKSPMIVQRSDPSADPGYYEGFWGSGWC